MNGNAWRRIHRVALALLVAANGALSACGGGTDERPAKVATGPVVGAPERPHCPERTMPVPPGADFSGRTLSLHDIPAGQDLRGANFDGATLTGWAFRDLTGATFRGAHLTNVLFGADFGGALVNTNFEGAVFDSATGIYAGLDGACFIGASFLKDPAGIGLHIDVALVGVDFSYSDVLDVLTLDESSVNLARPASKANRFRGVKVPCVYFDKAYLKAMDLAGADLSGCESALDGKDMSNVAFAGMDLRNFHFDGTNLAGATFAGAQLGGNVGPRLAPFDKALNLGTANFSGSRLSSMAINAFEGIDLSNAELDDVYISGSLKNAHFERSTLTDLALKEFVELDGARFTGATLVRVAFNFTQFGPRTDFTGARITGVGLDQFGTGFIGQSLDGVTFDSAVLNNVIFEGTSLVGTSFRNATIGPGTTFRRGRATSMAANAAGAHFENLNGAGADFTQLSAVGAHFDNAMLAGSRWTQAVLDSASFQNATLDGATGFNDPGTRLSGVVFNLASARGVDFSNAKLYSADFSGADLEAADFSGAALTSDPATRNAAAARFDNAHLQNASFAGATLNSVSFRHASLYGSLVGGLKAPPANCTLAKAGCDAGMRTGGTCSCASMVGADLTRTDLSGAFLYGVDFSSAATIVNGTIFSDAILVGANFSGAKFSVDPSGGGAAPRFDKAWLQGANLGTANLDHSTLRVAFVDFGVVDASGTLDTSNVLFMLLSSDYTGFRNWTGGGAPCLILEFDNPTAMPSGFGDVDCPNGDYTGSGGCGRQSPRVPTTPTNPRWFGASITTNQPVAASYRKTSTYEQVPAKPACSFGDDQTNWFATHYPPATRSK